MPDGAEPGRGVATASKVSKRRSKRSRGLDSPWLPFPASGLVLVAFVLPLLVLLIYSFWPTVDGQIIQEFTLDNYKRFFESGTYWQSLLKTFLFVAIAATVTTVVTFPFAYFVATKANPSRRLYWILIATIPFWTSYLIRVFAWLNLLGDGGLINQTLQDIGLISQPLGIFGPGKPAIVLTFIYLLFPLTFLSTYIAIERMNPAMLEAASDLGARRHQRLLGITIPIAKGGIVGGFILAFIAMMGDYVTPQMIGGTEGTMYANLVINQFGNSLQWGFGSTLALFLLVSVFMLLAVMRTTAGTTESVGEYTASFTHRRSPWLFAYSLVMLVFLYVPIGLLVLFAFNDSETVGLPFKGFTLRWFETVKGNDILLDALITSLKVAVIAVGVSLVIGSIAAVSLARSRGLRRNLNLGLISLPLFLPPVVLGLAIIIGLNALNINRGLWTIIVGHTVLILPFATLLVMIRLEGLDRNHELAAMDLGAKPWTAFLRVSVPQALPGILAAAMISFAMSLDEFIMTFLITGSETTLPLYIYGSLRFGLSPELNAISSLIVFVSFVFVFGGALVVLGRKRLRIGNGAAGGR